MKLGVFFSLVGLALVIVEGPVLTRISKLYSEGTLIVVGCALLAVSFLLFSSASDPIIFTGIFFFSLGNGIMWPSFLAILSKAAGSKYQGVVQGYASSAGSLASIIGLLSGGFIFGIIDIKTFWIAAALMGFIFFLSFRLNKPELKMA